MRPTRFLLLAAALCLTPAGTFAEWGWYRGSITTYSAANTSSSVSQSVHDAVANGFDWVVLSSPPGTGAFVGLNEVVDEIRLTVPRLTPILGTAWRRNALDIRILGIDSRAPIPSDLEPLAATVRSHRGVAVLASGDPENADPGPIGTFSPIRDGRWTEAVAVGRAWDRALTEGRRIFIASVGDGDNLAAQETTLWAEGPEADRLIAALRTGASYVSDRGAPDLDLQVDGRTFGATVFHEGEVFVRIRAHGRTPVARALVVADGEEIWSAAPDDTVWEERFFLPVSDYAYLRVELRTEDGARTIGNPVFLVRGNAADGELPLLSEPSLPPDDTIEMGGLIEGLADLPKDARRRVLGEFLADTSTRYGTAWLLQNRTDVVTDGLLADIALAEANDDRTRLGAAYALVTRSADITSDILLAFIEAPSPDLQTYAARMFAHYSEGFTETDWPSDRGRPAEAAAFLIRAYHPNRYVEAHVTRIIRHLQAPDPALSAAANDKLIELGTRHYRVIQALMASTRAGNAAAADVLGAVGDHRTVAGLQEVFRTAEDPDLRRSVFLALARMGAPYPDRRRLDVPELASAPAVDGRILPGEWADARRLAELRSDWNGRPLEGAAVRAGAHGDSVYFAVTRSLTSPPVSTLSDTSAGDDWIELALAAPPYDRSGGGRRTEVRINAFGLVGTESDLPWRAVSRVTSTAWHVECAAPISDLGRYRRFNIAISPASGETGPERRAWSVTYGAPDDPDRYGELHLPADTAKEDRP